MIGRVLVCAGSDSGAGAGIQADLKTIMALGAYGTTAITALTAQNTLGVQGVYAVEPDFVAQQMVAVLDDIGADVVKTGMLFSAEIIEVVASVLTAKAPDTPLVLDPVMIAKGGAALLADAATAALKSSLIPRATVLTPNVPEAETLLGSPITSLDDMVDAAKALLSLGSATVLLKGGHLDGATVSDVLVTASGTEIFSAERIVSRHTHGTGCTLASAIAASLAQGMNIKDAVMRARAYVLGAMKHAPALGQGHGPLAHSWMAEPHT